ncbi:hypothetical protein CLAFUW4_09300 [Fulvia fulva]|uniref:Uncharacterized protein n=1 Tax=Passalora fulva TaxID=5499 RepID=A0A9Q8UU01_PASFU|nr:uncharacterized protein CLAFUR5_09401 [Fulvia fulva]KAK4613429.1 hypothetical protein CLAFUR4_09306 [Fulvia fulva]KAK4614825.1 hypothetical protein CLAFUR0_09298 [Fulvia fulva]UJO22421.1 hypothetical protein CLAFUR5_09401 [Fulvia fulva]WPV19853.1 hypothetical protein CLAFUW4_09300 [Fulvia fulva]WPV34957.1 hypothetical protein CLAFUW7_09301 [Fulvia fulva]
MGAATTPAVERPMFLSADQRKISYQSKGGITITLEFKNSKAIESLRTFTQQNTADKPENMTVTVDGVTKPREENQGLWMGIYDTLSFWCMEAMEVAAFGPYDEPPK